jgi:hypothetical protein
LERAGQLLQFTLVGTMLGTSAKHINYSPLIAIRFARKSP